MTLQARLTAGDTLKATDSHADYSSADGWALSYVLISALGKMTITATAADEGGFEINEAASATADWLPDVYRWQQYFSNGGERYSGGRGELEVIADFAQQSAGFDARSQWQQILDNLKDAYQKLSSGRANVVSSSFGDRSTTYRSTDELLTAIRHAEQQVLKENRQQALREGRPLGNKINFRA